MIDNEHCQQCGKPTNRFDNWGISFGEYTFCSKKCAEEAADYAAGMTGYHVSVNHYIKGEKQ